VVAWAVLIEVLVLWPAPPDIAPHWLGGGFDKVVHAALFAVLAALAAWARAAQHRVRWPAAVGAALFGAFTEGQQHFIPSRSMELGDLLADTGGAMLGLALFAALALRRRGLQG
jgi:VanZ family protein